MEPRIATGSILVGLDGSEHADQALRWAVEQARAEDCPLALVHAAGRSEAARREGSKVLERATAAVADQAPDLEVESTQVVAEAHVALLELATDAAMVVVGTRGRGPVKSLLLGSVSLSVARHARCPVAVVRPTDPGTGRHGVLVGTDTTPESRATVEWAYAQADRRRMPLTVLHTFLPPEDAPEAPGPVALDDPAAHEPLQRLLQSVSGLQEQHPDVHVSLQLARGLPEQQIVPLSRSMDLVVVGHHRSTPLDQVGPGTAAISVLEHAHCPVVVVPGT